jgi:hypothetical protein
MHPHINTNLYYFHCASFAHSPSVTLSPIYTDKWYIMPDQLLLNMPFFRVRMPYNQFIFLYRLAVAMFLLPHLDFRLCILVVVCLDFDTCSTDAYSFKWGHAASSLISTTSLLPSFFPGFHFRRINFPSFLNDLAMSAMVWLNVP